MPAPGWLRPSLQLLTETVDVDTDLTDTLASTVMWRWTVYTTIQKLKKIEIVPPPSVGTEDELPQIITTAALLDCDKISSLCLIVVQLLLFCPDLSERAMVRWRWRSVYYSVLTFTRCRC